MKISKIAFNIVLIISIFFASISNFTSGSEAWFLFYIFTFPLWIVLILSIIMLNNNCRNPHLHKKMMIWFSIINCLIIAFYIFSAFSTKNASSKQFGTLLIIALFSSLSLLISLMASKKFFILGELFTVILLLGLIIPFRIMCNKNEVNFNLNEDNMSYSIVNNYVQQRKVIIPATYNGLPVTKIIGANDLGHTHYWQNITIVAFEEGSNIELIGVSAFCDSDMKKIHLPNSVKEISSRAFVLCKNLREVYIPKSVTIIGKEAFSNCRDLTIYCEASQKPDGWDDAWAAEVKNLKVIWGNS